MIKMIVSDMDGTLLNSRKSISEENIRAIEEIRKRQKIFILATGRIFASAAKYAKELGIETPIIACNGALIKSPVTGEIFYEKPIPKQVAERVMKIFEEEKMYYHFYTDVDFYTKELKYTSLSYHDINQTVPLEDRIRLHVEDDLFRSLEEAKSVMKFVAIDDNPLKLEQVRQRLQEINEIEQSQSWYNNIEVMSKGISKGSAMEKVAEMYGMLNENVMAIGDHLNDISMIRKAGYGVAMGNAEEMVKEAALYVTSTNDQDGFAKAVRHYMQSDMEE